MEINTDRIKFKEPLRLESGRILEEFELVYETYGKLNEDKSNVIVICHALAGSHHAAEDMPMRQNPDGGTDL